MQKSVNLSKNFNFVNNRRELLTIIKGKDRKIIIDELLKNIEKEYDIEDIKNISIDEWLSAQFYIDEFITGVSQNNLEKQKQ